MSEKELATSPDGQWIATRAGRLVTLLVPRTALAVTAPQDDGALATPRLSAGVAGAFELASDDADLAGVVGPPAVFLAVVRGPDTTRVALYQPPELEPATELELGARAHIETVGNGRIALVTEDRREMTIVRAAGRGLASHPVDLGESPIEFAVAIERNQLVISQPRKLEVWDAVSGRPLRRLAMELPPPPRLVGAAAGHMWIVRPGTDEIVIYRLSDGRPFRHYVGAPIDDVAAHPMSPLIVLVTRRGLVRLHCFAHSLFGIDSPWQPDEPLAQLVSGDDISLLGWSARSPEPWSVAISGSGAPGVAEPIAQQTSQQTAPQTAADKLKAMRDASPGSASSVARPTGIQIALNSGEPTTFVARPPNVMPGGPIAPMPGAPIAIAPIAPSTTPTTAAPTLVAPAPATSAAFQVGAGDGSWRDALASFARELLRGVDGELPPAGAETTLHVLGRRLGLSTQASRALGVLYALHLVGEPAIAIARLAFQLGDWTEALGQGQLGGLAMLERARGTVALAPAVTDLLDGAPPRDVRLVGGPATTPRAGAWRLNRDGRTDAEIEAQLARELEHVAIVEGRLAPALLEARLYGATAVALAPPGERPRPWPIGAGLVLVLYGTASAWIADVPLLPTTTATADQ